MLNAVVKVINRWEFKYEMTMSESEENKTSLSGAKLIVQTTLHIRIEKTETNNYLVRRKTERETIIAV